MKGKIIKDNGKYLATAMVGHVLQRFSIDPPAEATLSTAFAWTRHDCCICGHNFRPYTPQGTLTIEGHHYPICDECLQAECPNLYRQLLIEREKFDASLNQ
jgi:hypothetical protein